MLRRDQSQAAPCGASGDDFQNKSYLITEGLILMSQFAQPRVQISNIFMSCHVIVRNRLSLSMGSRVVAAGANHSLKYMNSAFYLTKDKQQIFTFHIVTSTFFVCFRLFFIDQIKITFLKEHSVISLINKLTLKDNATSDCYTLFI